MYNYGQVWTNPVQTRPRPTGLDRLDRDACRTKTFSCRHSLLQRVLARIFKFRQNRRAEATCSSRFGSKVKPTRQHDLFMAFFVAAHFYGSKDHDPPKYI